MQNLLTDLICVHTLQVVLARAHMRRGHEQPWTPPTKCPLCDHDLQDRTEAAEESDRPRVQVCVNPKCQGQQRRRLYHFAATCLAGVGPKTVDALLDAGLVSAPEDFFRLTLEKVRL